MLVPIVRSSSLTMGVLTASPRKTQRLVMVPKPYRDVPLSPLPERENSSSSLARVVASRSFGEPPDASEMNDLYWKTYYISLCFCIIYVSYNTAQGLLTTLFPGYGFYRFVVVTFLLYTFRQDWSNSLFHSTCCYYFRSLCILYSSFAFSSWVAPLYVKYIGRKKTMILGGLSIFRKTDVVHLEWTRQTDPLSPLFLGFQCFWYVLQLESTGCFYWWALCAVSLVDLCGSLRLNISVDCWNNLQLTKSIWNRASISVALLNDALTRSERLVASFSWSTSVMAW